MKENKKHQNFELLKIIEAGQIGGMPRASSS